MQKCHMVNYSYVTDPQRHFSSTATLSPLTKKHYNNKMECVTLTV